MLLVLSPNSCSLSFPFWRLWLVFMVPWLPWDNGATRVIKRISLSLVERVFSGSAIRVRDWQSVLLLCQRDRLLHWNPVGGCCGEPIDIDRDSSFRSHFLLFGHLVLLFAPFAPFLGYCLMSVFCNVRGGDTRLIELGRGNTLLLPIGYKHQKIIALHYAE